MRMRCAEPDCQSDTRRRFRRGISSLRKSPAPAGLPPTPERSKSDGLWQLGYIGSYALRECERVNSGTGGNEGTKANTNPTASKPLQFGGVQNVTTSSSSLRTSAPEGGLFAYAGTCCGICHIEKPRLD